MSLTFPFGEFLTTIVLLDLFFLPQQPRGSFKNDPKQNAHAAEENYLDIYHLVWYAIIYTVVSKK